VEINMFTKILVPLDGSDLAERALKPAFVLAKKFQSEILLLRIATPEEVVMGFSAMPLYPCDLRNVEEEPGD
jgi:nucleotide-binding universal stress UspA family protein